MKLAFAAFVIRGSVLNEDLLPRTMLVGCYIISLIFYGWSHVLTAVVFVRKY